MVNCRLVARNDANSLNQTTTPCASDTQDHNPKCSSHGTRRAAPSNGPSVARLINAHQALLFGMRDDETLDDDSSGIVVQSSHVQPSSWLPSPPCMSEFEHLDLPDMVGTSLEPRSDLSMVLRLLLGGVQPYAIPRGKGCDPA